MYVTGATERQDRWMYIESMRFKVIYPDGNFTPAWFQESPVVGERVKVNGRAYRVRRITVGTKAHVNVHVTPTMLERVRQLLRVA